MNTENMNLKGPMDEQVVQVRDPNGGLRSMTLEEVKKEDVFLQQGIDLANRLINMAMEQANPNGEFLTLRYAAIHILGGQVFNIGMGSGEEADKTWNPSRAFAAEKDIQEHLSSNIQTWKTLFDNGHIRFTKNKV